MTNYAEGMDIEVIARDLYTLPQKHDFLTAPKPDYDVLLTNPVGSEMVGPEMVGMTI